MQTKHVVKTIIN